MPVTVGKRLLERIQALLFSPPALVVIDRDRVVSLAAQHLVDGHARAFPFDVPERHVHGRQDIIVHRSATPVRAHLRALPEVLDTIRVFAQQPRFQMIFQRRDDGHGLEMVVGRTDSVKARFAGDDLQEYPAILAAAVRLNHLDVFDGERGVAVDAPGVLLRG